MISTAASDIDRDKLLAEVERRISRRKLLHAYADLYDHSKPPGPENRGVYAWQVEFHNAGADHPERGLIAANRVGKTTCGAAEVAIHATGLYPPWWKGRMFNHPVRIWCGSVTNEASKDVVQKALLGEVGQQGSGWIPAHLIENVSYRQAGVRDVVDSILVDHVSGLVSEISLKTYEQGREKWQGAKVHVVWLDEVPPMEIYTEAITRTLDAKGLIYVTFTAMTSYVDVVMHFVNAKPDSGIYMKSVSWDDAPHLDEVQRKRLWESYPIWERDVRTRGGISMGTGAVFPVPDEMIACDQIDIKPWWRRINGVDFGIDHPAAGAFCALDTEGLGTFYVYDCYRAAGETPIYHAAAMRKHGDWIPNAWPHDGIRRDPGSGIALKDLYRRHSLHMLKEHAHYPDERGNHTEPGLIEMDEWMRTGRFKVFRTLRDWFEEKRMYHRKDGQVVKLRDDIMSATRYAFIMRRYARPAPSDRIIGSAAPSRPIIGGRVWLTR